jgi:hypothetical protein
VHLGGAHKLAQACTSPTSIYVSCNKGRVGVGDTFTPKQRAVIGDVLAEATQLLGSDAAGLRLEAGVANRLGLADGATFGEALRAIAAGGDRRRAGAFVRAVLALRRDPRVQGYELDLSSPGPAPAD